MQGQVSSFGQAGLVTVLLPSGYRLRGAIPSLAELAYRGLIDGRIQAAVARLASDKWLAGSKPAEQDERIQVYVDALVAGFPREALDPGGDPEAGPWLPTSLVVEDLWKLDSRDRDRLEDLVMRVLTADEITAGVLRGDYELPGGAGKEQASALDRLAEFRSDSDGTADSGDGADLARAPIAAAAGAG